MILIAQTKLLKEDDLQALSVGDHPVRKILKAGLRMSLWYT